MANIKDLKQRISSITNTRQITNAMKMVAAAKLRKAQSSAINIRPYANETAKMIQTVRMKQVIANHPFLSVRANKSKILLVVLTGDKGLCGSFNSQIIRKAEAFLAENPNTEIISIGKKGNEFFKKHNANVLENYTGIFQELDHKVITEIAQDLEQKYLHDDYKEVVLIYNAFKSAIESIIVHKTILPVANNEELEVKKLEYLYEPDEETIVEELVNKYTFIEIKRALAESFAAENASRMTAMDNATENASDLISELSLEYNRERQASITTEIIEVSSGAEAINN
jgi:F-type H+-transporting ATPase subunit gamma